jgi:hypothetical protein
VYELRLTTTSTTRQIFQVTTDGTADYQLPASCDLGVFNCPFATILPNGTVTGKTFTSGHALFEPSNADYYLYKINAAAASGYFAAKRNSFEADLLNTSNAASIANPTYVPYTSNAAGYKLQSEDGTYASGSFKKSYHILVSPTSPPPATPEGIHGFALSNCATASTIPNVGLHCIFPSKWNRPKEAFFKLYFEQNWGRA